MVKLKNELWDTLINTSPALESLNQGGDCMVVANI